MQTVVICGLCRLPLLEKFPPINPTSPSWADIAVESLAAYAPLLAQLIDHCVGFAHCCLGHARSLASLCGDGR